MVVRWSFFAIKPMDEEHISFKSLLYGENLIFLLFYTCHNKGFSI